MIVLAVKVLRAPIFLHLGNFETERYMYEMKSLYLQETYEFDSNFFVVSCFVPKLRKFQKNWSALYIFDCEQVRLRIRLNTCDIQKKDFLCPLTVSGTALSYILISTLKISRGFLN